VPEPLPENEVVQAAILRLNARAWGITFGLLIGGGLFVATAILVLKGGTAVGQHLQLLSNYFPGYSVTWVGSLIGFVYGFVGGYAVGRTVGWTYNKGVRPRK